MDVRAERLLGRHIADGSHGYARFFIDGKRLGGGDRGGLAIRIAGQLPRQDL